MNDKIAELGPIAEAIRNFQSPETDREKLYVIAHDEYMGTNQNIYEFHGTWRQLLEKLNNVTDENRDEVFWVPETPGTYDGKGSEKKVADLSEEELVKVFNDANGDGQPYYLVWCVDDHKKVLG